MSKSRKVFEDEEQLDETESVFEDADDVEEEDDVGDVGDVDTDIVVKRPKDDDDDDDDDDRGDDGDDDEVAPKKRAHIYHQSPESTEIRMVAPHHRVTSEYMTIYEFAMVVGTRATHIAAGSILYTDPQSLHDPRDIAKKEIAEGKCPLSITRKVSPTMMEVWEVNEMIKPPGVSTF